MICCYPIHFWVVSPKNCLWGPGGWLFLPASCCRWCLFLVLLLVVYINTAYMHVATHTLTANRHHQPPDFSCIHSFSHLLTSCWTSTIYQASLWVVGWESLFLLGAQSPSWATRSMLFRIRVSCHSHLAVSSPHCTSVLWGVGWRQG